MMSSVTVLTLTLCRLILMTLQTDQTFAFNVNTKTVNVIVGPKGSHFGFTTSFLPVDENTNSLAMLVGAPNANTTSGGQNSGILRVCKDVLAAKENCSEENHVDDNLSMVNGMVNEEFGSALVVTETGHFMVCSPNWKDTSQHAFTFTVGRCTYTDLNNKTISKHYNQFYEPTMRKRNYIRNIGNRFEYYNGLASFGFSVDSDKSSVFVMGAPGVLMSEGTVVIMDVNTGDNSVFNTDIVNKLSTTAFGYMGYSVKIGRFCDGTDICFAASGPNTYRVGIIFIYRWENKQDLKLIQLFKFGERPAWSYFGYAMCAVNTDGDVYDELLVGAPYYTDESDAINGHDQGRVFIYARSKTETKLMQKSYLDGNRQKFARFGTAVQNIGDINLDTYSDVAVGAPGEDDGAGCIYIYLGGPAGLVNSHSQRIAAKQVSNDLPEPVRGFGFSFSEHAVPGKEKYPVFVASAVNSDAIFVFRTRTVVDVTTSLNADPNPVDDEVLCREQGITGSCFKVTLCMKYSLRGGGNTPLSFQVGLDIDVLVRPNLKRALIRLNSTNFVESVPEFMKNMTTSDRDHCTQFVAVLREHQVNQDRFTPVLIVTRYKLLEDPSSTISPMLDATKANNASMVVTFVKNCGDDNICNVDLAVKGGLGFKHTGNWSHVVVNGTKELYVNIGVRNSRDPSYWTVVTVEVDSALAYSRIISSVTVSCFLQEQAVLSGTSDVSNTRGLAQDKTVVLCNYYKPLHQNASFDLTLVFETEPIELTKRTLTFKAQALPQNEENNPEASKGDNTITMKTFIQIIADVYVAGSSSPSEVTISEAKQISLKEKPDNQLNFRKTGNDINPQNVTHKILVTNNGPSFLPSTNITVSVPLFLLDRTQFIDDVDVKIVTADGRVAQCHGTKEFAFFQGTTSSTIPTTDSGTETKIDFTQTTSSGSKDFTATTPEESTFGFGPVNARKKRAVDDKEDNKVYTLNCDDEEICQVFICETGTNIPSGKYAEINVALVVDLANIPLPEKNTSFYYAIQTNVIEPVHPLFKAWTSPEVIQTVTKFHLVQPGGTINIWIIIGCVIAGLILITIIVLIFWKLGFFKRSRHQQVEQWRRESKRRSRKGYSKAPDDDTAAPADNNLDAPMQ